MQSFSHIESVVTPRSVAEIFSERAALEAYLRVESALAVAQADLGIIPKSAAEEIRHRANFGTVDLERLREQASKTGYPIAPLVRQLSAACGEHARWVHWGATTQDVVNTGLALQVNEAWDRFAEELRRIIERLIDLTESHRDTLMVARTFGGHALPITFGFKAAVWLSAVLRHAERIAGQRAQPMQGEFAGVAGTLASLGGRGLAVRKRLMELLKLPEPLITWSAMRDSPYERASILAGLTGTLAKIMQDVAELSSTEIGELAEPATGGKDSSSTLPFKANPILCARATSNATFVAQLTDAVLQAGRQRQERSGEGLLEFQALPSLFIHAEKCLAETILVLEGLEVFPQRMRSNLDITHGIILAECYMMALAPHLGRLQAHDLVHDACREAVERNVDLVEVLAETDAVTRHLNGEALARLADPRGYLGDAQPMIDAVLIAARRLLERS
jgi:3-carboxy-cis,cis-muconate cycloisomerase